MRNYERYIAQQEDDLAIAKRTLARIEGELSDTKTRLSDTQTKLSDTESELSDAKAENLKLQKMAVWAKEHGYAENF